MSKKKKAVAKMKEEKKVNVQLTEEQFENLDNLISWDHPLEKLSDLSLNGESNKLELGFKMGEVYSEFKEYLAKLEKIIDEIRPEEEVDFQEYDWDDSESEN